MKKIFFLIFCLGLLEISFGQSSRRRLEEVRSNDGAVILLNFAYGGMFPGADMAERFGANFLAGANMDYYTPQNWIFGVQGDFMFGKEVKTDVLKNLRGANGYLYSDDGGLADIRLRQRALLLTAHFGKVFPLSTKNKRSGIRLTVGGGFMQHKIRIQDEPAVFVSSVSGDSRKGYDRMANGAVLTQFIGYQFVSNNRLINFSIGAEFSQGFTQGRRSFNFDTRSPGLEKRLDLLNGFRLSWTLPLFIGENADEINY